MRFLAKPAAKGTPPRLVPGAAVCQVVIQSAATPTDSGSYRKAERLADPGKNIALNHAAGIALINGRSQVCKPDFVLTLFTFQRPQGSAHHFAGVLVTSTLSLLQYETIEFVGQINIARRHGLRTFPNGMTSDLS